MHSGSRSHPFLERVCSKIDIATISGNTFRSTSSRVEFALGNVVGILVEHVGEARAVGGVNGPADGDKVGKDDGRAEGAEDDDTDGGADSGAVG